MPIAYTPILVLEGHVQPDDPAAAEPALEPIPTAVPDRREEARNLCRSLIQAERTVPYRVVKRAADNLGLPISRGLFSSVQRELAGTVRNPEMPAASAASASRPADPLVAEMRRKTSAMDFTVGHLTTHPNATYEEVQTAAEAAGHVVFPITYGRARQLAGLPARSGPRRPVGSAPNPAMAFMVDLLSAHPRATYKEVKVAAAEVGHQIFPITFGNARRLAGLAKRSAPAPAQRRSPPPAAPPTTTAASPSGVMTEFVQLVERLERHREDLRSAMSIITQIARSALERPE